MIFDSYNIQYEKQQQAAVAKNPDDLDNVINDKTAYVVARPPAKTRDGSRSSGQLISQEKEIITYLDQKMKIVNQQIKKQKEMFKKGEYRKLQVGDAARKMASIQERNIKTQAQKN